MPEVSRFAPFISLKLSLERMMSTQPYKNSLQIIPCNDGLMTEIGCKWRITPLWAFLTSGGTGFAADSGERVDKQGLIGLVGRHTHQEWWRDRPDETTATASNAIACEGPGAKSCLRRFV